MLKKELQELIDSAIPYKAGQLLSSILLIPTGEPCQDAFNTDNQYENIIMLGVSPVNDKLLYINKGSTSTDVLFSLMAPIAAVDLPTKYHGAIHVHFATWVKILDPENNAISPVKCDGTDIKITPDETAFVTINKGIPEHVYTPKKEEPKE